MLRALYQIPDPHPDLRSKCGKLFGKYTYPHPELPSLDRLVEIKWLGQSVAKDAIPQVLIEMPCVVYFWHLSEIANQTRRLYGLQAVPFLLTYLKYEKKAVG